MEEKSISYPDFVMQLSEDGKLFKAHSREMKKSKKSSPLTIHHSPFTTHYCLLNFYKQ